VVLDNSSGCLVDFFDKLFAVYFIRDNLVYIIVFLSVLPFGVIINDNFIRLWTCDN